jgi:hypothetical protein
LTRLDNFKESKERRALFRRVLTENEDGKTVLAIILNLLGYFATDPDAIDPKLQAVANKLLQEVGSLHFSNIYGLTDGIASASNDLDLDAYLDQGDPNEEID